MSKKSKALSKKKNLIKKRAIKAANRARYDELRNTGQNRKTTRSRKQSLKKKRAKTMSHPQGACGNIGCKKCDPCGIHWRTTVYMKKKVA